MPHKRAKRSVREADKAQKGYNLAPTGGIRDDHMPRGAARIFNAMKVQADFRASGRKTSEDTGERYAERMRLKAAKAKQKEQKEQKEQIEKNAKGSGSGKRKDGGSDDQPKKKAKTAKELPKIGEHETLGEYNRRVESLLRGGVNKAIKAAEQARGQQIQAAKDAKSKRVAVAQGKAADGDEEDSDSGLKPNRPERTFAELPQRKRLNDVVQAPPQLPRLRQAKSKTETSAWGATGRNPLSAAQQRILETERQRVVNLYREMKAKKETEKEKEKERKPRK